MKFKQGLFFRGSVTIGIKGKKPELFLNQCIREEIPIWDVKRKSDSYCVATVYLASLTKLRKIRKKMGYQISIKDKWGLPFIIAKLKIKQPLLIGLFLSLMLIFVLSNMVWQINIVGVSPEMEYKIKEKLDQYGLKQGVFKFSLQPVDDIERNITNELKDVMWLGIEERGTTYIVQGVEKSIANRDNHKQAQHLVASKDGTILEMLIETGSPQVSVYQKVEKGDILVSGVITEGNPMNEEADEENKQPSHTVQAKGSVIAETWYKTVTTVPLQYKHETLSGEKDTQYRLRVGNVKIPIWDILPPNFKEVHIENDEKPIYFLSFALPFSIEKHTIYEKEIIEGKRDEKTAIKEGIEQAKHELKKHTDHEAEIIDERILHQEVENDKVKLQLLFIVRENIAIPQPINQGE